MRLRIATMTAHERLDAIISVQGFFESRVGYVNYLRATLRVRGAIEACLDASDAESAFPAWPTRRIAGALHADLADLGADDEQNVTAMACPFRLAGVAPILGALYVLEGSALGARLLTTRAALLGLGATFGARHLAAQTAAPSAWRVFLDRLEGAPMSLADEALCVESAINAFEFFEHELTQASVALGERP